nr:5525_t:CDS:2 [Entrophospora candida]CAG8604785.1 9442_t:CDS:2 [Entrophospora candida]
MKSEKSHNSKKSSSKKRKQDDDGDTVISNSTSSTSSKDKSSSKKKNSKKTIIDLEEVNDQKSIGIIDDDNVNDVNDNDVVVGEKKNKKTIKSTKVKKNIEIDPFSSYNISKQTIDSLKKRGIESLFPIQSAAFNPIYNGKDVLARAKTGTAMIITPTRDLAKQISAEFESTTNNTNLKTLCVYGGVPYDHQTQNLREGLVDILVGTPGRILDHINYGNLKLSELKFICLDEADQMLDIGFAESIETVLQLVKKQKQEKKSNEVNNDNDDDDYQTLLFSATIPDWVKQTVKKYLKKDYENINLIKESDSKTNENIRHLAIRSSWNSRKDIIGDVVACYAGQGSCVIFCNTKNDANELALNDKLKQDAQVLHGDIAQSQRETTMKGFREGKFKCIICTDVLARGIDIPEVDLVINCEPPKDVETYVHRSGRTARAGRQGTTVTFFKPQEEQSIQNIQRHSKIQFQIVGPPQPQDIILATANGAIKNLQSVQSNVLPYFHETAKKLVEEQGAIQALSAALAYMSGYANGIKKRSLMSAVEGYTTLIFRFAFEIKHGGYARNIFKSQFSNLSENSVKAFRLTKDMRGVVCDIDSDQLHVDEEDGCLVIAGRKWYNNDNTMLEIAENLPELLETNNGGGYGRNNNGGAGRNGYNNNRNGYGNNRNGYGNKNGYNNNNGKNRFKPY